MTVGADPTMTHVLLRPENGPDVPIAIEQAELLIAALEVTVRILRGYPDLVRRAGLTDNAVEP